ncbi:hypothetical protein GPALN_005044 [Globodera pallida]|nr:hypothetical protein GPALN_005044 [Globodera pallida]
MCRVPRIELNEEGTEAVAATAVFIGDEAAVVEPEPAIFIADRPFLMALASAKLVLFNGSNEEGSEAAAATGVVMMTRMALIVKPKANFVADQPFNFMIAQNDGQLLFSGIFSD